MDLISSSSLITTFLGGTAITVLIGYLRPCIEKRGYNIQVCVLVFGFILGLIYTGFSVFVPEIYKTSIINFIVQSIATSVFVYEFIWKNINKDKEPPNPPQI